MGGGSSLNMYQAKSGVKTFFPLHGGVPSVKIFFSSLNMYQAKSGVKTFFPLHGGGKIFFSSLNMYQAKSLCENFFFQSEHVSSQIWCQNFFPFTWGGGVPSVKIFFSGLNMYQAKSGVKKFSLY